MHTQTDCAQQNRGNEHTRDGGRISDSHHSSFSACSSAVHCQAQEARVSRRTDGSWVRPDRREKEGVATQEVLVNYAACSSHLQRRKKQHHQKTNKLLRKVCANGQHCSARSEAVPTQGAEQSTEERRAVGLFSRKV